MTKLRLEEIMSSPMMNVDHIYRYSGTKLVEPESLATHIYETMMIGYLLIDNINHDSEENLDKGIYLEKALHHDMEESLTGDVARPLKYHNSSVKHELNVVAEEVARSIYDKYFQDTSLFSVWDDAKYGKEGLILKIADMLTVVNKAIKEVKFLGNMYCLRVVKEVQYYINELTEYLLDHRDIFDYDSTTSYLVLILDQAKYLITNILDSYECDEVLTNTIPTSTVLNTENNKKPE